MNVARTSSEADQQDLGDRLILFKELLRFGYGDACRAVHGKSISAGADGWERDSLNALLFSNRKTVAITTGEQLVLPLAAAAPDRADCVNHPLRR